MSMFAGVSAAKEAFSRSYFKDGLYLVQITNCKGDRRFADNLPYIAVTFDILRSNNEQLKAGSEASWVQTIKNGTPALSNIKQLIAAAWPCDPSQVDEAACDLAVSREQPLRGNVVMLRVATRKLKDKVTDFSQHTFEAAVDVTEEQIAALRAAAGLPVKLPDLTEAAAPAA